MTTYRDANALVLGASGFIGRAVADALVVAGARVTATMRPSARVDLQSPTVGVDRVVPVDLLDATAVDELLDRVRPDIVFNLAGYGVDRSERDAAHAARINTELVAQLAAWVARAVECAPSGWRGARLVHTGSALELGPLAGVLRETSPANPDTLYGRTKLGGTRAVERDPSRRSVCARLFTVYGPGEHAGRLLPTLLDASANSQAIPLTAGRQQRDFTFVGDVVTALLQLGASQGPLPAIVNVATGHLTTVRAFTETAAAVLGIAPERLHFGALPTRDDETPHGVVDLTQLRALLGWVPATSIATGVELSRRGDARSATSDRSRADG